MSNIEIALVSTECLHEIGNVTTVEEMLQRAFAAAKNHWGVLDRDAQLKGALNAVLTKMSEDHPDRGRLLAEIRLLGQFNSWLQAAQAGLSVEPPEIPEGIELFGIMKLWHESLKEAQP